MPGKGSGGPVGAPPTVRTGIEPNPQASPHSHPTRVLLQSISGVEVQCPEWDLVLPVGAPPRCEPQSNRTSKPAPFAPDTGAPTINIRRWGSIPRKGIWRTCRSTAHGANRNRTKPQNQPPFAPDTGAPTINIRRWGSMPGKGSGVPVGAPPTVRTAIEPRLRTSPIRTRHGCSYNQYPALGFNARNRDLVLPVGAPPTVRTAIKPNLKASPIRTRHGCSYNQYPALGFNARNGIWFYL